MQIMNIKVPMVGHVFVFINMEMFGKVSWNDRIIVDKAPPRQNIIDKNNQKYAANFHLQFLLLAT